MAQKIRGITIKIGGDTSELSKALDSTNKKVKETQYQLKDVNRLLKLDPKNTELLKQKQELLAKAVSETKDKLENLRKVEQQLKDSGVDKNSEQFQAVRREVIDTEKALKDAEKAARDFSSVGFQQITQTLDTVSEKATAAGKTLTKNVTAPIVAGFGAAVKVTADFDKSMSQVAAVSGATGDELEVLRDKAREMGATTKFSAADAADAMNYMAMAGWKADDMLNGIEGIMALAAASGEDLATTSDIVTDALTAFGYTAADAGHFADVLAAASSNANTNVSMLGESFKYVAPVAGSLGYSAEDVAVALGLMANSGIKAGTAGAALRTILSNMANPSEKMANAMNVLGVSLDDGQGNMKSLMEVMQDFRSGFGDVQIPMDEFTEGVARLDAQLESGEISEKKYNKEMELLVTRAYGAEGANKAMYASMLAGQRGMSALLAIVNTSDEDFEKLTESIYNSDGAAQEMADIMQDNLAGQLEILKSQLQELAISVGDILMPVVKTVVGWIQKAVDWLNSLDNGTKNTIVTIAAVVAAIGPLLIVIGKIAGGISAILTLWPKLKGLAIAINAFTAANPILLIVSAVAALTAAFIYLWNNCEGFRNFFINLWATIKNTVQVAVGAISNFFAGLWAGIQNGAVSAWAGVCRAFGSVTSWFRDTFSRAWQAVKDVFSTGGRIFEGIKEGISSVFKNVVNHIIAGINTVISIPFNAINGFLNTLRNVNILGVSPFGWIRNFGVPQIPYLAKGGILERGMAVVGDAGPELLTMSAGGAVVQPLTNATNTTNTNLGGVSITIYGAPGQDIHELAEIVMDEMQASTERRQASIA